MPNTPTYILYHGKATGRDRSGKKIWTRIGAAWPVKSGTGFSITLEYQPLADGIMVMLPYDQKRPDTDGFELIPDEQSA